MCDYSFVMQSFSRFLANIAVKRFVDAICFRVLESPPIWALSRRVVALLSAHCSLCFQVEITPWVYFFPHCFNMCFFVFL